MSSEISSYSHENRTNKSRQYVNRPVRQKIRTGKAGPCTGNQTKTKFSKETVMIKIINAMTGILMVLLHPFST